MLAALAAPLLTVSTPTTAELSDPNRLAEPVSAGAPPVPGPVPGAVAAPATPSQPAPAAPPSEQAPAAPPPAQGEILVSGRPPSPVDPVEHLNVVSYQAVQAVDAALVGPIARTYKMVLPKPVRDGVHNALDNLDEPIVFVNFLLQLKPGKAMETAGRFLINSTLGIAGLVDVAKRKPFNLPRRSNGLADTLGYYGVGPGPYLFLPVIGATTVRDLIARPFDLLILPTLVRKPFSDPKVALAKGSLSALDERAQNDEKLSKIHSANDPYLVQREEYLARRKAEIEVLKGKRKSIDDPPYYTFPDSAGAPATPSEAAPAHDAPPGASAPTPPAGPAPAGSTPPPPVAP